MFVNNKLVDINSIRIAEAHDITQHHVVYAEFFDGVPLEEDELLELDEQAIDMLVDSWYTIYG
jgi:hypothetical protein